MEDLLLFNAINCTEWRWSVIISELKKFKKNRQELIIYCAGLHGREFKWLLEQADIQVDYFCDNSADKQDKFIDGIKCIHPEDVKEHKDYKVVICTGIENYNEVYKKAKEQGIENIIDYFSILDDYIYNKMLFERVMRKRENRIEADLFYTQVENNHYKSANLIDLKKERIAVYTSCFGEYDRLNYPKYIGENIDYYVVSDERPLKLGPYKWIDANNIISEDIISPIKRNRYIKMHPEVIFPQYKYSIYMDANIEIKGDISSFICDSKAGISVFLHSRRDCIYYEAMTIVNYKRIVSDDAFRQMSRYLDEGMPLHFGMTEMPVIAREHHNPVCKKIMDDWWREFDNESQRDQLSFPYVLWKNALTLNDLSILGDNVRHNHLLNFKKHRADSLNVKNNKK